MHFRKLFEIQCQRAGDRVKRTVRLAFAGEIYLYNTIGIGDFTVSDKTVEYERKSLIAFDIARALEIFIQHGANQILSGRNKARRRDLIRKLPGDQSVVVCEIDVNLHIKWRARGRWRVCDRRSETGCKGESLGGCQ